MPNPIDTRSVALRLRTIRVHRRITSEAIASRVCMLVSRYKALEKNFPRDAQDRYLAALAAALDVSETWLATGEGESPVPEGDQPVSRAPVHSFAQRRELRAGREALAQRAKLRRVQLGISAESMATQLGLKRDVFLRWEGCLLLEAHPKEALWERLLRVEQGWLRNEEAEAASAATRGLMAHAC